jgi:3-oxoacyl-[acyl-carrier-protein] synthase II
MSRRVVVTGGGGICPLGSDWAEVSTNLKACRNQIRRMDWDKYTELNTRLGAPVENFTLPAHYTRKRTRSMGRNAKFAVRATELALEDAGLLNDPVVKSGRLGISYGSSTGSTDACADFVQMLNQFSMGGLNATTYLRMMSHTAAVNIGVFFGITGRVIPTSSACTSGSQGVGYAYEAIKYGMQDLMVAGGSEELCPTEAAVFDLLYATSTRNDDPISSPRPFDRDRDGLVIGEGACTLVLEEFEHARARGAPILAEIIGFGTNSDGAHVTRPHPRTMAEAMRFALVDADLPGSEIGYVSAHGTATDAGDIAESQATREVLGYPVPISSLKSYIGHTLGACGSLEAWMTIHMMREGWFAPTVNLDNVDERCADLDYICEQPRTMQTDIAMSNNFAFGGINTSLIFKLI